MSGSSPAFTFQWVETTKKKKTKNENGFATFSMETDAAAPKFDLSKLQFKS